MKYTYVYDDELYHHGTLGQKWGRRLYQNPDGSLTPLGRVRYGVGKARDSVVTSVNAAGARIKKSRQDRRRKANLEKARQAKIKKAEEAKKLEETRAKYKKNPNKMYKHKELYTNDELAEAKKRLDAENNLKNSTTSRFEKLRQGMDTAAKWLKTAKDLYTAANDLYKLFDNTPEEKTLSQRRAAEYLKGIEDWPISELRNRKEEIASTKNTLNTISDLEKIKKGFGGSNNNKNNK